MRTFIHSVLSLSEKNNGQYLASVKVEYQSTYKIEKAVGTTKIEAIRKASAKACANVIAKAEKAAQIEALRNSAKEFKANAANKMGGLKNTLQALNASAKEIADAKELLAFLGVPAFSSKHVYTRTIAGVEYIYTFARLTEAQKKNPVNAEVGEKNFTLNGVEYVSRAVSLFAIDGDKSKVNALIRAIKSYCKALELGGEEFAIALA